MFLVICQIYICHVIYIVTYIILSFFQAPKQYPYNNLYLERGGDPEKQPEEIKNYEI